MQAQLLDKAWTWAKERGITIKAQCYRELNYTAMTGETYMFHFGRHAGTRRDFYLWGITVIGSLWGLFWWSMQHKVLNYKLCNVYLALDNDLEILPVINNWLLQLLIRASFGTVEDVVVPDTNRAVCYPGKAGIRVEDILEQIVEKVPAPTGNVAALLRLNFDSVYDIHR